ncbi:MAG: hypothetical protein RL022_3115, partial [Chloroflexota bacterium]
VVLAMRLRTGVIVARKAGQGNDHGCSFWEP